MPIDERKSFTYAADKVSSAPLIRKIVSNPIYTAIVIVIVMMMTVMIVFWDVGTDEHILVMTMRVGFWTLLTTVAIVFLHDRVLDIEHEEGSRGYDEVFDSAPIIARNPPAYMGSYAQPQMQSSAGLINQQMGAYSQPGQGFNPTMHASPQSPVYSTHPNMHQQYAPAPVNTPQ